jgi:hypothetical protein
MTERSSSSSSSNKRKLGQDRLKGQDPQQDSSNGSQRPKKIVRSDDMKDIAFVEEQAEKAKKMKQIKVGVFVVYPFLLLLL